MKKLVYDILIKTNVPVKFLLRPDMKGYRTGISYHFFNQGYQLHGDGWGNVEGGAVQVDVFSLDDYESIVEQIKTLMKESRFRLVPGTRDLDDEINNVRLYHKVLIFNYSEQEVLK